MASSGEPRDALISSMVRQRPVSGWLSAALCCALLAALPPPASPAPAPASRDEATASQRASARAPIILLEVHLEELPTHLAKVTWTTNKPTTGRVDYDLDEAYELGAVIDAVPSTTHSVILDTLVAGATYHVRILARDVQGHEVVSGSYRIEMTPPEIVSVPLSPDVSLPSPDQPVSPPIIVEAPRRRESADSGHTDSVLDVGGTRTTAEATATQRTDVWSRLMSFLIGLPTQPPQDNSTMRPAATPPTATTSREPARASPAGGAVGPSTDATAGRAEEPPRSPQPTTASLEVAITDPKNGTQFGPEQHH